MKNIALILTLWLLLTTPALGAIYRSGESVDIPAGETVDSDFFSGSRTARISGVVNGDVFAGGDRIVIDGRVTDDVQAGCRTLQINGIVGDGVIFFGQELLIDGDVGGDVTAFGAEVRITPRAVVHGDLFVAAGRLKMTGGHIEGSLRGYVGECRLNGRIDGTVDLETGKIHFGENFQSTSHMTLTLSKPLDEAAAGRLPEDLEVIVKTPERTFPFFGFFGTLWSIATAFIIGLIPTLFFKDTTRRLLAYSQTKIWPNTGLGFVYLVVIPVALLILFILIITIPVALIALALYLIALYLGGVLAGLAVGDWLIRRFRSGRSPRSLIPALLTGIILIKLLSLIPFIGWLIGLAMICYGSGSLIHFLFNYRKNYGRFQEDAPEA